MIRKTMFKFKKLFESIGLLVLSLILVVVFLFIYYFIQSLIPAKTKKTEVKIKGQIFISSLAETPSQRQKGLSGLKRLEENEGMLFVFRDKKIRTFWMKDVNFGLDIIFIDGDKIVDTTTLKKSVGKNIPSYISKKPADKVLEINAGMVDKIGMKIGDKIEIKNF